MLQLPVETRTKEGKLLWQIWQDAASTDGEWLRRPEEPLYGGTQHVYIADTDEEARERVASAWPAYRGHFPKPMPPGQAPIQTLPPRLGGPDPETPAAICGSPETVRHYVQAYAERSGANYFAPAFQWGNLTHNEALRSLTLFASEIMPSIKY